VQGCGVSNDGPAADLPASPPGFEVNTVMMKCQLMLFPQLLRTVCLLMLASALVANAQSRAREFRPGAVNRLEDLPVSRLRTRLQTLPVQARLRAVEALRNFHFTELDLQSLDVDRDGGVFYADNFTIEAAAEPPSESEPIIAQASVPVAPFADTLIFHSKPGAPNVLYLNFTGETLTGTAWNNSLGRSVIPALAFSSDSDYSTFSDTEQAAIKHVWQRVAEDYAPFNIDVTTERPASFNSRIAHALITRNTDANNESNPSSSSGGVAYINVFGSFNYNAYRPAWIYYNNLSNNESYIAEAVSHEVGHNLGLSHDGKSDGTEYYSGHGTGSTSWGPIMGGSYNRNVSQWSKGEYYMANNTQDDLTTIAARVGYRSDDHADTVENATSLVVTGTNIVSTTPENDPTGSKPANKGTLERNTDVDTFVFTSGNGAVRLAVNPWTMPSGTRGGNLDIVIELRDAAGTLLVTNDPAAQTSAQIQTSLTAGTYFLVIRNTGVGVPLSSPPGGYTTYGSIGEYFISGYIAPETAGRPSVQLVATANNPAWGTVDPATALYTEGSAVLVRATPAEYYEFVQWTDGASGASNPLSIVLDQDVSIQAVFAETLTTNYPTPHQWLASHGYTDDFENSVTQVGANGMPLWQSYIAGLDPNNPISQVRLHLKRGAQAGHILSWDTAPGRLYTLWWSTNVAGSFTPVPGASDLPATVQTFTNAISTESAFYQLQVRKL
jgi:hypothetical protein